MNNSKENKPNPIRLIPIKDIVNPWGGEERVKQEVDRALKNHCENPQPFNCRKCGDLFQPAPWQWIFYDLCDRCFIRFDTQKMMGRRATLSKKKGYVHHFEDATEWILHGDN